MLTSLPNYPTGHFFEGYGLQGPFEEDYKGNRVLRVPLFPRGHGRGFRLTLNYLSFAVMASVLGPILCRGRYDLIFVYEPSPVTVGIPAIVMKKLKRLPMVFWVQDLWPESLSATGAVKSRWVLYLVSHMVRYIYRSCNKVMVQSPEFAPRVESFGIRSEDILYLPNWANVHYRPLELSEGALERSEMPSGFKVVFGGNIGAAQGFETILAAAQMLKSYPDIQWVILGDGRKRTWVEDRIERADLKGTVHLLGSRPSESMPRYFALADALLVTLRRNQIFSLTVPGKVQSYLACGRPIVASLDGEGARIVRESGSGVTAPAQDADALAEAVLELYRMPTDEREEMGRKGREYFEEHFEREKLLDRLEGWMHELVGKRL